MFDDIASFIQKTQLLQYINTMQPVSFFNSRKRLGTLEGKLPQNFLGVQKLKLN